MVVHLQRFVALLAEADFLAVLRVAVAHAGGSGAGGAHDHEVGDVDGHFLIHDPAGLAPIGVGLHVALGHIDLFHHNRVMLVKNRKLRSNIRHLRSEVLRNVLRFLLFLHIFSEDGYYVFPFRQDRVPMR